MCISNVKVSALFDIGLPCASLCDRTFCHGGNVLYPHCAMRQPPVTCDDGAFDMWLV